MIKVPDGLDGNASSELVKSSVSLATKTCTYLPIGYVLKEHDVYCGRGKESSNHIGNIRFQLIIAANIDRYRNAGDRNEKISLTYEIVDYIRSLCHDSGKGIGFVKKDRTTGFYFEVGDLVAVRSC
jgi:hypothetical protein